MQEIRSKVWYAALCDANHAFVRYLSLKLQAWTPGNVQLLQRPRLRLLCLSTIAAIPQRSSSYLLESFHNFGSC